MITKNKTSRLVAGIGKDLNLLLDAHGEAQNNAARGEIDLLALNLKSCFDLARRIEKRRASARKFLGRATR